MYAADFETTVDRDESGKPSVRVWIWGMVDVNIGGDSYEWSKTITEFMERAQKHNATIYFHNLKYDGNYIVYWLLTNGYKYDHQTERRSTLEPGHFRVLYSDKGKFFSMTVHFHNGRTVEFRDSLKKIPMRLAEIPGAFNLPESKGDMDYDALRPVGHEPTPEEHDYTRRDVLILGEAVRQVHESGATRLTVGSDALHEYKGLMGDKWFRSTFPVLAAPMDKEIRHAYRGGFTYADPRFRGQRQGSGLVLDVNSLYPYIMYDRLIPYGEPRYSRGLPKTTTAYPLSIFSVELTAKLKPGKIPCIQIKNDIRYNGNEYLTIIKEPTSISVTNVDWQLINEHYDVDVHAYGGGWLFHAAEGLFDEYIDKWSAIKAESKGGQRAIAKLFLNSLYGKYATNTNVTGKYPELVDGAVKWVRGADQNRPPVYTAAGVFITAYARELTIRAAQSSYGSFAYADTDSLHLLRDTTAPLVGIPHGIDVHPSRMGAWKLEYYFDEALYVRPKSYLERKSDGTYEVAWAGVPEAMSEQFTFDSMIEGRELVGKLNPVNVPGGQYLQPTKYTLNLH